MTLTISREDVLSEGARALLALHLAAIRAVSAPGHSFVLDLAELAAPGVTLWSVREGGEVVAIGALKEHPEGIGEIKSMRSHPSHLRRGIGGALLDNIIAEARARSLRRLSLETGSGPPFEAALALYRSRGFRDGGPFADYAASEFSQFLHLDL